MSKAIIILGNGFDLDLGLKTSYSDFANSHQWSDLMSNNWHSNEGSWLLGFLKSKYDVHRWIDIEAALLEYATAKTRQTDFSHASEDADDFKSLCDSLKDYLREQQNSFFPTMDTMALFFLRNMSCLSNQSCLYTFNYTLVNELARKCGSPMSREAIHIHGSLSEDADIILGIEGGREIDDRYSFLYKTQNRRYGHTNLLNDLSRKEEYVFYGHSLNGMDYAYFNSIFTLLANSSINSAPRITIITKDVASEAQFKNFLRKRISLQGLFSYANPVFILTDLVYQNDKIESQKMASFLERVKEM